MNEKLLNIIVEKTAEKIGEDEIIELYRNIEAFIDKEKLIKDYESEIETFKKMKQDGKTEVSIGSLLHNKDQHIVPIDKAIKHWEDKLNQLNQLSDDASIEGIE